MATSARRNSAPAVVTPILDIFISVLLARFPQLNK
jgi:hypothetical protein